MWNKTKSLSFGSGTVLLIELDKERIPDRRKKRGRTEGRRRTEKRVG
jgi:hypothetical protein